MSCATDCLPVWCLQTYGVYMPEEPTPLKEGEGKHVISIFVADEAGLINRVAGVFGRRGECCMGLRCMAA